MFKFQNIVIAKPFKLSHALLLLKFRSACQALRSFTANTVFTTKLLNSYCKSGRVTDAKKLFDEMPDKNVVSWTTMIYGYATNGLYRESLNLFSLMQFSGLAPNSFTIVSILVSLAGLLELKLCDAVHGKIVKSGFDSDLIVLTATVNAYAKCGNVVGSYQLFKKMSNPSLISCNAMIAGFVHNGLFEEAALLFNDLRVFGLKPNPVTMLSVIQSCSTLRSVRTSDCMHGFIVKIGLDLNISVMNSVLDMYLNLGDLELATDIFNKMAGRDVISWTTMIRFLVWNERASDALEMFHQMLEDGTDPDLVALANLITACALLKDLIRGRSVHNRIVVCGLGAELTVTNSLISMYSKCGDLSSARIIFNNVVEKSLVSWTAMISGFQQNGQPIEALGLLSKMRLVENFNMDSTLLATLVTICGELACLDLCKQSHAYIFGAGFLQHNLVQNSLVAGYAKCGDVELAHRVFNEIIYQNTVSWNTIISGYGINGNGQAALSLFHDMERSGEEPDNFTYLSVLHACSHSGLVDEGLMIFHQMEKEKKIQLRGEHWGCIADMLARSGHLSEANEFVKNMPGKAGSNVWKAILGGCLINNNLKLAELVADKVLHFYPEDPGNLVLLSNMYAFAGRFEEAETLRSRMRMKGLVKDQGVSLLDMASCNFG